MQLQRRRLHHGSPLIVLQVTPYFTRCHATWPPAWCDAPSALCRTGAGQSGAIRLKGVVHAENNMLTLPYFLSQYAKWLFSDVAGMNKLGVADSFHSALQHTRKHIVEPVRNAETLDLYNLCYNFQAGTSLLMAALDGMTV
jgi:hypothetical protein